MVYAPTTQAIAIACGVGGAYVDVTADVMDTEGSLSYSWGNTDPLQGPRPGQFSFTLADPTGTYTPDNPLTPLGLPLTEGMGVSWQMNSRIVVGTIRSLELIFPSGAQVGAARVRVTCDDILGDLSRAGNDERSLRQQYIDATALFHWSMDAPNAARSIFDTASGTQVPMVVRGARVSFGREPLGGTYSWGNGVELNASGATGPVSYLSTSVSGMNGAPSTTRLFAIDARPTREAASARAVIEVTNTGLGSIKYVMGIPSAGTADYLAVGGSSYNMPISMQIGQGYEVVLTFKPSTGLVTAELFGDSGYYGYVDNGVPSPFSSSGSYGINIGADATPIVVERVYIGSSLTTANANLGDKATTLAARIGALSTTAGLPGVEYVGSPLDLSTRSAGQQTGGRSFLDSFSDAIGVDGGRLYGGVTAGSTLTSFTPVVYIVPGKAARSTTLTSVGTFSTLTDISGAPETVRDTTNRYTQVVATSETASLIVKDPQASNLPARSGNFYSPVYDPVELQALASDYLRRARFTGSRIRRITIDLRGTNGGISRWADVLALYPGARVRVADMPTTQFALGYWDGWFIGAEEVHTAQSNVFNIYLEPYLPAYIYDTARFAAGGILTLTSGIASGATTISVSTTGAAFTTSSGEFPQKIIIDREVIQLNSAPTGSPQVFTGVTRGVANTDGVVTLAASHLAGANVEIHPTTEFRL